MLVFWWPLTSKYKLEIWLEIYDSKAFSDQDTGFTPVLQKVPTVSFLLNNNPVLKTSWSNKMWVWSILISCATSNISTIIYLSMSSRKAQYVGIWSYASSKLGEILHRSMNGKMILWSSSRDLCRFRGSSGIVDLIGSFHYLYDLDRHTIRIALILSVWFPVTHILNILRFHFLEFHLNRSNYTFNVYRMITEDLGVLK